MDTDLDGKVDSAQFQAALEELNRTKHLKLTTAEMADMFRQVRFSGLIYTA